MLMMCTQIEFGVDVNVKSKDKVYGHSTALILAAQHCMHSLIPYLLKHGANVLDTESLNLYTALHTVLLRPGLSV